MSRSRVELEIESLRVEGIDACERGLLVEALKAELELLAAARGCDLATAPSEHVVTLRAGPLAADGATAGRELARALFSAVTR